jgi:multisubunit Na+/H+ antiporter MnhC subunit
VSRLRPEGTRLTHATAVVLSLVGVYLALRATDRMQLVLGLAMFLSAVTLAVAARTAGMHGRR